jgi:hypothetical protein
MRTFASVVLLAVLAVAAGAQQKSLPPIPMDGAPDIEILGAFIRASDAEGRPNFSVEIRNTGKHTIKAVTWEYYLSMPSGKDTVDIRISSTSEGLGLKPGEKRMLQVAVRNNILDPVVSNVRPSKIRLTSVEYDGGSSWSR